MNMKLIRRGLLCTLAVIGIAYCYKFGQDLQLENTELKQEIVDLKASNTEWNNKYLILQDEYNNLKYEYDNLPK